MSENENSKKKKEKNGEKATFYFGGNKMETQEKQ